MSNPKIEKIISDIEKTKSKILAYQSKLRDFEREKTRLENEQIIALVRSEKISDAELTTLMKSLRKEDTKDTNAMSAETPATGKEIKRQEETRYANLDEN